MPTRREKELKGPEHVGSYCPNCRAPATFNLFGPLLCTVRGNEIEFYSATCQVFDFPAVFSRPYVDQGENTYPLNRDYPLHRNALTCQLPLIVDQSYKEALRCEEAHAWLACVVMVGRTLEAICREHFPDDKHLTIFSGIKRLHEQGIISEQLTTWADELRVLRNIGAHATTSTVTDVDAREAVDFLKAILENLYDLAPKFEAFKKRRADAK